MAILPILQDPDPCLRRIAKPVTEFGPKLQALIADMFQTMYDAPGVGLAAPQVGVSLRLCVMDTGSNDEPQRIVMINPVISDASEQCEMEEGCLSVPEMKDKVLRYNRLTLKALNEHGQPFVLPAEGLLAQAIQHEIDHLDGKLYVDYLSSLKRERYKKKRDKALKRGP